MVPDSFAHQSADRTLMFQPLERKSIGLRPLILGSVLSVFVCSGVLFALEHGAGHLSRMDSMFVPESQPTQGSRKPTPQMTLSCQFSSAPNPTVMVSVVVTGREGYPTPTGAVNFLNGWKQFHKEALVDDSTSITAKLSDKTRLPIRAIYLGDDYYISANSVDSNSQDPGPHACSRQG